MPSRRQVLRTTGTALLTAVAGCSSNSGTTLLDTTQTVEEREYSVHSFSLDASATLSVSVTVTDGPNVDVYVATASEVERYENGNRFDYEEALSRGDAEEYSATASSVAAGEYGLVVDHTKRGTAAPSMNKMNDPATVELTLTKQ